MTKIIIDHHVFRVDDALNLLFLKMIGLYFYDEGSINIKINNCI